MTGLIRLWGRSGRTLGAVLAVYLCPALASAGNLAKEFAELEERVAEAEKQYQSALAEYEKKMSSSELPPDAPAPPDPRVEIVRKMNELVHMRAEPERFYYKTRAVLWGVRVDLPNAHTYFEKALAGNFEEHAWIEVLENLPTRDAMVKMNPAWVPLLEKLGQHTKDREVRAAALCVAGQIRYDDMHDGDKARDVFASIRGVAPNSVWESRAWWYQYEIEHGNQGDTAPNLELDTLDGQHTSLVAQRGNITLVVFWSSDSDSCRGQFPYLREAAEYFKDRPFRIVWVSFDPTAEVARKTVEAEKLPGIHTWVAGGFDSNAAQRFNVNRLPRFVIVDDKGAFYERNTFGELLKPALERALTMQANRPAEPPLQPKKFPGAP